MSGCEPAAAVTLAHGRDSAFAGLFESHLQRWGTGKAVRDRAPISSSLKRARVRSISSQAINAKSVAIQSSQPPMQSDQRRPE
jgi:hypothetical protein